MMKTERKRKRKEEEQEEAERSEVGSKRQEQQIRPVALISVLSPICGREFSACFRGRHNPRGEFYA